MWQFWLIFAGIFLIGEIATTGFLLFWLTVGCVITALVSILVPNIVFQTTVFVLSSIILILATKPFVNKFANNKKVVPTNVYTLNGKKAIVIEDINPSEGKGLIKVNGEVWSAICDENTNIPKGSEVEIVKIQGVKAYVNSIQIASTK